MLNLIALSSNLKGSIPDETQWRYDGMINAQLR